MDIGEGLLVFRKFFGSGKTELSDISKWNEIGREVAISDCAEIEDFHQGKSKEPKLSEDTRGPAMAEAVLQKVIALNREGRGQEAREIFDPAHTPFISELEKGGRGLICCAILGPEDYLVQQGTTYQDNTTWRVEGDRVKEIPNISAFSWSRNRKFFAVAHRDGSFAVGAHFDDPEAEQIPSISGSAFVPKDLPDDCVAKFAVPADGHAYSRISISDDGTKLLLCDEERGVMLLAKVETEWQCRLLFPSVELGVEEQMREFWEDDDDFTPFFDMIHAALSPDGSCVALGTQDDGHHLLSLIEDGQFSVFAHLGYLSNYPHNACFSNDSKFVALNSCHFYNGVTFVSELELVRGLTTEPYEQHVKQCILNDYLRVYASGYLPSNMAGHENGAFLLAGSGYAACVLPDGELLWELGFGSSAGAVDICQSTGRVLIASYSGMLHILDLSQKQSPAIFSGYNVPKEVSRWVFWDRLERPIIW